MPILLFIIVGGVGLQLAQFHRSELRDAAYEVAIEAARTDCSAGLNRADDLLGYQPDIATCSVQAQLVTVTLGHSFPALLPFLPETITVSSRALTR